MPRFVISAPLFLVAALFAAPLPLPAQNRYDGGRDKEKARQQIGITTAQQDAIEALFADVEKQEKPIHSRLHALYHDLQTLYDSYEFDAKQARSLRDEIGTQQKSLLTLYASKEERLRRILTRAQFERLRAQMKESRDQSRHERRNKEKDGK